MDLTSQGSWGIITKKEAIHADERRTARMSRCHHGTADRQQVEAADHPQSAGPSAAVYRTEERRPGDLAEGAHRQPARHGERRDRLARGICRGPAARDLFFDRHRAVPSAHHRRDGGLGQQLQALYLNIAEAASGEDEKLSISDCRKETMLT